MLPCDEKALGRDREGRATYSIMKTQALPTLGRQCIKDFLIPIPIEPKLI